MKKRLTSFVLVFALSFSLSFPAFAVDDSNYYSLPPVTGEPSLAIEWPVSPAVSHDGFLAEDSQNLARIMTDLTTTGLTTLKTYILDIRDSLSRGGTVFDFLSDITNALTAQSTRGTLAWYIKQMDSSLASIDSAISASFGGQGLASENTLKSFSDSFQSALGNVFYVAGSDAEPAYSWSLARFLGSAFAITNNGILPTRYSDAFQYNIPYYDPSDQSFHSYWGSFSAILGQMISSIGIDGQSSNLGYGWTLYHYVKNLSETLASEDDKQLAQNQKENREQAATDFLSGQSGKTSLGKGDFSNASQVGGALNDTFNMGGAAKVSDFVSGFGSAGEESLSWFSDTTANNLDGLTAAGNSTSGVSSFSDDGETMVDVDPDPYNMANIFERYYWLEGVLG